MRISKDQVIEGLPAPCARELMRAYQDRKGARSAMEILAVTERDAVRSLERFCAAGYLTAERSRRGKIEWIPTVAGNALAQASLAKPIKRTTADRLLQGVVERAGLYNADPD